MQAPLTQRVIVGTLARMILKAKHYRHATVIKFLGIELAQTDREVKVTEKILAELEWEEQLQALQAEVNKENEER